MSGLDDQPIRIDGQRLDADITDRLIGWKDKNTMEGASSVELTIDDHDLRFFRSGALTRPGKPSRRAAAAGLDQAAWQRFGTAQLALDGYFYRFAGMSGSWRQPTLTFENEIAALMRAAKKPLVFSRGGFTRAEAIGNAAAEAVRKAGVHFSYFSPQEGQRQPIAAPEVEQAKKGIHSDKHLTVKGIAIDSQQRKNVEIALAVADDENAGERATLALLVAGIGESGFRAIPNSAGSNYWGVWQGSKDVWKLTDTKGMARSFLRGGKGFQAGGAISYAAAHPDASPGTIAYKVEGDRANFSTDAAAEGFYQRWAEEANAILEGRGGVNQVQTIRENFHFRFGGKRDGKKRNYWDNTGQLADKVNWRRFAAQNILWFVNDEWLFSRRPLYVITPEADGLLDVDLSIDVGQPVAEVRLTARAAAYSTPPGAVVDLEDFGGLTGKWLIWESTRDRATGEVDIVLRRPAPQKKEPAPGTREVTTSEETPEAGSVRAEIVRIAKKAAREKSRYRYRQQRPMHDTLFPAASSASVPAGLVYIDCSEFVTLVYKAAGAPDPNGSGYNGSGWTGTLVANGTRTEDPQPGDLVFYGPGPPYSHVGIFIGGGKVIEMGGTPGPLELKVKYRNDFGEYRTYDVEGA